MTEREGKLEAKRTAKKLVRIQQAQDKSDASKPKKKRNGKAAVQAGPRKQPAQLPEQHLQKPGREADLKLAPRFLAPGNLLERGIRVNEIAPGPVWTPLNPADKRAQDVASFGQGSDMKRAAQPEELSPAYVFLASPVCSAYITGIVLPVTGSIAAI